MSEILRPKHEPPIVSRKHTQTGMTDRKLVPDKEFIKHIKRRAIVAQFAEPIARHRGVIRDSRSTEAEVVESIHMLRRIDSRYVEPEGFGPDVFNDAELEYGKKRNS